MQPPLFLPMYPSNSDIAPIPNLDTLRIKNSINLNRESNDPASNLVFATLFLIVLVSCSFDWRSEEEEKISQERSIDQFIRNETIERVREVMRRKENVGHVGHVDDVIKISKEACASLNPIVLRLFIYLGCSAVCYFRPSFSPPLFSLIFFMNDP